jgi:hypothetical protein
MSDDRIGQPVGFSNLILKMGKDIADTQYKAGDITADEYKERIKILYPGLELIELPDKKADGGKPKKFQSGRSSALDDPNSLDIMAPFKSPDMGLGSAPIGDVRQLLPLLAMGAFAATPSIVSKSEPVEEDVIYTPGGVIIKPPPGISEEEKKRLGLGGYAPVGGGMTPTDEKDKLPQSTGGPPPEQIDTTIVDPIPEPIDMGGGFTPIPEEERMQILTMGDKKESKALVPTKMMENIDDIDIGELPINKRFSKVDDYIKSNYSGNEKKTLEQWTNELTDPQKGLGLELRDSGKLGFLNNAIAAGRDKDKLTSSELLELFNSTDIPNQIAANYFTGSAKKLGEDQELLPQNVRAELQRLNEMDMVFRPGPLGDFMAEYKSAVEQQLQKVLDSRNREDASLALAEIPNIFDEILDRYPNVTADMVSKTRQNNTILTAISNTRETLVNNQFTNEHMTVGFPNIRVENYSVLTHSFEPAYGQASRLDAHNETHPLSGHDIAFSRSAKLLNYANDKKGTVMMELQTDIFDGKVKAENIKFPGSQPKEGSDLRYEDANDNFYPFSGGAQYWIKQVVKDNLEKAIADGDAFLGWSPADVVAVYEQAGDSQSDVYKGFKTIYDGRIAKYIKDINKDITKRGKQLGLNDEQLKSVQLQVKDNGIYRFERRPGDGYSYPTSDQYVAKMDQFPGLKNHVRVAGNNQDLVLINMPYIDLQAEGFDLELFKKIGLPQFKKGGKTSNDNKGDPLIDIEIFMGSI